MIDLPPLLLADIIAHRDDDGIRLIAADWWEDHGESERAEYIRVQCEIARIEAEVGPVKHDHTYKPPTSPPLPGPRCPASRLDKVLRPLRDRERPLKWKCITFLAPFMWDQPGTSWTVVYKWLPDHVNVNTRYVGFRRGFVEDVALSAENWIRHAEALCASVPLRNVRLLTLPELVYCVGGGVGGTYGLRRRGGRLPTVFTVPDADDRTPHERLLESEWPRLTFTLPS